jgi:hypothetical protein
MAGQKTLLPSSLKVYGFAMTADVPNSAIAADLAAAAVGSRPIAVRRFSAGSHHYVYEATFEDGSSVVVRIAAEHVGLQWQGLSNSRVYFGHGAFHCRGSLLMG